MRRFLMIIMALAPLLATAKKETPVSTDTISASRAFLEMPIEVLDILPVHTRGYMLGYYGRDSIWTAENALEGESRLINVTPDFLKVQLTQVSTLEIKVLPSKKGDIVMSIYTLNGGEGQKAGDSQISFFDASMKPLPKPEKVFQAPRVRDFFSIPKGSQTSMKEIEEMIPFPTIVYRANPENTNLEALLTVGEYMNQDDFRILSLFLLPSLTLRWDGAKFK